MNVTKAALLSAALALGNAVPAAFGILTIGAPEAQITVAPPNGAPWNYVARLSDHFGVRASGVYLGNGYILSANHVDHDMNVVHLNGADYAVDTTFPIVTLQGTDMLILKIVGNPGLPPLPLIEPWESEFNMPCTMIGWGVGKGSVIPNQGWNWIPDDSTRVERWATNVTLGNYSTEPDPGVQYVWTAFDFATGGTEGNLTLGDSGGGLFLCINGVWKLAGINADTDLDNEALYDEDLNTPGYQPDHSYFAAIKPILSQIRAYVPLTNEPILPHIVTSSSSLQLYWPASATGWSLYSTTTLAAPNWAAVTTSPTVVDGFNMVTLPMTNAAQFYELRQGN